MTAFISRLNPITQVLDLASLFGHALIIVKDRVVDIATDPIAVTQRSIETTNNIIEFISTIARFTSDTTYALYYLSTQEGQQRVTTFCENIVRIGNAIDASAENISAKDLAGFMGHFLGDFFSAKVIFRGAAFLKELDIISKISDEVKIVAQGLKHAIEEHPAYATAEGIALKMSHEIKEVSATKNSTHMLAQTIATDTTSTIKNIATETECLISQTTTSQEAKAFNNIVPEIATTPTPTGGKIQSFPNFEQVKDHIFSDKHKTDGILNLGSTEKAICDKFVEIIKEADIKNLLKEGPNNIVTTINNQDVTIRAFVKNDHIISYDGFIGLSNRKVDNKIYL